MLTNLLKTNSIAIFLKWALITLFSLLTISGCRLVYKPLSGSVGFNIEHLELSKYRIEYHADAKFEYVKLENHLLRYASEVCLSEYSLEKFEENIFTVTAWADVKKKPPDSKVVSTILNCEEINQAIYDKSFSSKL